MGLIKGTIKSWFTDRIKAKGEYLVEVWDGPTRWEDAAALPVRSRLFKNLTTLQGLANIQDCELAGSGGPGPGGTWYQPVYIGLINAANFSSIQEGDTAQKITSTSVTGNTNQWLELTAYSGGVRLPIGALAQNSSGNSVVATTLAPITFSSGNNSGNIQGAFIVNGSSAQGPNAAGVILRSAANNASSIPYTANQTITVVPSLTLTSS